APIVLWVAADEPTQRSSILKVSLQFAKHSRRNPPSAVYSGKNLPEPDGGHDSRNNRPLGLCVANTLILRVQPCKFVAALRPSRGVCLRHCIPAVNVRPSAQ